MSLATSTGVGGMSGAGGAGGGLAVAHHANAMGRPQPPPQSAHTTTGHAPPPPSAAALGADLLDKNQSLSLKQVKNLSHLPIVAIDLHGESHVIAMFPKKPEDPSKGVLPVTVGKMKMDLVLKSNDEVAHKTLRKYLTNSKSFASFRAASLAAPSAKDAVVVHRPYRWLGLRRLDDAPEFVRKLDKAVVDDSSSSPAISEETSVGVGATIVNGTLDGSPPTGDDYDRVVIKVRLHEAKKALTMFPEEAVQILLGQAKYHVAHKVGADVEKEGEDIDDYPCAIAVPSWACHDAAIEALYEATGSNGVFFQRSMCALAGALLPSVDGKVTPLLSRMNTVRAALQKEFQIRQLQDPGAVFEDDVLLLLLGTTEEGFECTAVQVSHANMQNISCIYGKFKVLSNVSDRISDPLSAMEKCTKDLEAAVEMIAPEADGPAGIVLYGSAAEQEKISAQWEKIKASQPDWKKVPVFTTKPDCVAQGTAVLGAVSHGRLSKLAHSAKKKARAELALHVQNVAPVAVGIQMNYHGGASNKWTPVKTIFDFDRQIPAGPHTFDLNAAECAVHRSGKAEGLSEEEFLKATKKNEGAKGIPVREEAALDLRIQVLEKWTRDGEWKKVGDAMQPLVKVETADDEKEGEKRIACESVVLELSLGVTGMITTSLVGERESVIVATKSARNSAIRYYVGILFAILFFGGFLFKSYWDDYVLERDAARLLAYYKHVIPGSYQDGDEHHARYTAYKYRNKKDRLWKSLEKKYGVPVRHAHEWDDYEEDISAEEEVEEKESDAENEEQQESPEENDEL